MYHHIRNGLFVTRLTDGAVLLVKTDGAAPEAAGKAPLFTETFTASEWASLVASVCARGEDGNTWRAAMEFHDRQNGADATSLPWPTMLDPAETPKPARDP